MFDFSHVDFNRLDTCTIVGYFVTVITLFVGFAAVRNARKVNQEKHAHAHRRSARVPLPITAEIH